MPISVRCPNCGKALRAPDGARGKKLKCPGCNAGFAFPNEPEFNPKQSAVPLAGNLESTTPYIPSGICGNSTLFFGFVPVGVTLGSLGMAVGAAVGAIIGVILAFIYTIAINMVLKEALPDARASVITIAGSIGAWLGAALGFGASTYYVGIMACNQAHNRQPRYAMVFGAVVVVVVLIVDVVLSITVEPIANTGFWRFHKGAWHFLGLAVMGFAGACASYNLWRWVKTAPYCEKCKSYLSNDRLGRYSIDCNQFRKLAQVGDLRSISALRKNVNAEKANTILRICTCSEGCCGFLAISKGVMVKVEKQGGVTDDIPVVAQVKEAVRKQAKKDGQEWAQDKFVKQFQEVVTGMVDRQTAQHWLRVLGKQSGS